MFQVRFAALLMAASLSFPLLPGQSGGAFVSFSGELSPCDADLCNSLQIELNDISSHQPTERAPVSVNGRFEFRNLASGQYRLRILTLAGEVLREQIIAANGLSGVLEIRLPERPAPASRTAETISWQRLQHTVPSRARKLRQKADQAHDRHDIPQSILWLREALELDPEYVEAQNDLGSRFVELQQYDAAIEAFRRAAQLDPGAALVRCNLSIVHLQLAQPAAAEAAAREALRLSPAMEKAHYLLGLTLFQQRRFTPEALRHLDVSKNLFPRARILKAQMLLRQGALPEAKEELEAYLHSGHEQNRPEVSALLARVKANLAR